MIRRPRARHKLEELPPIEALVEQIARMRLDGGEPAAIVSHIREWRRMSAQPGWRNHWRMWPGGEETFDAVPVIISRAHGAPRVYGTQADLEDALMDAEL